MRHPFDLDPSELEALDLEFEEPLTQEESAQVSGGRLIATTLAMGEEGGCYPRPLPKPIPYPRPLPKPIPYPIDPPEVTTMALGEEGGEPYPPEVTTMALGEEGGEPIAMQLD